MLSTANWFMELLDKHMKRTEDKVRDMIYDEKGKEPSSQM
jgi:hypothetical protein